MGEFDVTTIVVEPGGLPVPPAHHCRALTAAAHVVKTAVNVRGKVKERKVQLQQKLVHTVVELHVVLGTW